MIRLHLPDVEHLLSSSMVAAKRFPIALAFAVLGCSVATYLVWVDGVDDEDISRLLKVLQSCFLAMPLMLASRSVYMTQHLGRLQQLAISGIAVALVVAYYVFTPLLVADNEYKVFTRFMGLLAAAHLLVAFAPFWRGGRDLMFWEYNKSLFVNIWQGVFYTVAVALGLMLAYLALDKLFGCTIEIEIYSTTWIWLFGLGFSLYFFFHFPHQKDIQVDSIEMDRVLGNFLRFILIPLVILYFLILYSYSLKILVQFTWPNGWISKLIIGFSTLGILAFLLCFPKVAQVKQLFPAGSHRNLDYFRKYFFYALLPMTFVLLLALNRRVEEYGLTEPRYFAVMLAVWLLSITLYMTLARKRSLVAIPMSLAFGCVLSVWGPLNAYQMSDRSQWTRLMEVVEKHGMMDNHKIVHVPERYEEQDVNRLGSALDYYYSVDRRNRMVALLDTGVVSQVDDYYAVRSYLNLDGEGQNNEEWKSITWNEKEAVDVSAFSSMQRFAIVGQLSDQEVGAVVRDGNFIVGLKDAPPLVIVPESSIRELVFKRSASDGPANLAEVSLLVEYGGASIQLVFVHLTTTVDRERLEGFGYFFQ